MGELYLDKRIILVGLLVVFCLGIVEALEIKSGTSEDLTIFLQNATTGAPIENATCVLDVWLPNGTKTLDDGAMTELGEGFYYFSTYTNWTTAGNYRILAKCAVGSENYYSAMMFTVVATTVTEWFETINQTTSNTYEYLQNTIYPAVDEVESKLDSVLANQTNLWNKLVEIQNNVTTNYNEIINTQNQLTDVNDSMMNELNDHKNRLIEINNTVTEILNNLTQTINPKLDQLQTDIDLIKGYTDTLEAGQTAILENLSAVQSTVDTINTNTDQVEGYVDTLEELLDCNGSTDTPICNKLDIINTTVNTINANTDSLEAGQTTITNYVDTLESGQQTIQNSIADLKTYLNCSSMPMSSICWRLDLIQAYTDTLEAGQTTITNYVDTLETNQSVIISTLNIIENYVDTLETGIADLDNDIQNLNSTMDVRFDTIDNNLSAIYTTVQETLSDQGSINASQTALLNQILTLTILTNSTVNWIEDYLNGTITAYLEDINQTVTDIYNLLVVMNSTVNSIYSDTQDILTKWGNYTMQQIWNKLDKIDDELDNVSSAVVNNTEILNAINDLESIVNDTRDELGFEGQSLTAYQYFVQLESELLSINTTLFNKIEFEHNATLSQMLAAIQSNTTEIISEINANEAKLDSILNNWGSYTAADIINNVTANRNKLIDLENWLNAFNVTEEIRHNESQSLINTVLAWLGIFNQSEAQRHNLTQTLINNLFDEVNDTEELSNQIIAMLGYDGKNSSVYNDLISLYNQNAQIIALAQEINLTTHQTYDLLFTVNGTVGLIYSDTQDILAKWGSYDSSSIMDKLNIMDSQLDVIQNSSNDTVVLAALADLETIVNLTRAELGFAGQSLTAYQYLVQLESELISINTTLFNKIEFEHNQTTQQILAAIQNSTTAIVNEIDSNEAKLDSILNKWGSYSAADIINNVTANRNKLIDLENWLNAFNVTEEIRHNESQSFIQTLLDWLGIFNSTEAARHAQTQSLINNAFDEVNDTEELCNQIIAVLGYSGKSSTVFEDLANLSLKLEQIIILTEEINLTTHSIEDKVDNQILPKLNSIMNDTADILINWGNYTANDLYTESLLIETKVDNIQVWLNSFNATEQQRYADVIDEVNDTEELLNAIRAELGFEGKSLTAYEYMVDLESDLVLINASMLAQIQTQHLTTRQELKAAIDSDVTAIITEINDNEGQLLSLLNKWGSVNADNIISNITENRNQIISLQAWLNAFNVTEEKRHNESGLIQTILTWLGVFNETETTRHNETLDKVNEIISSIEETKALSNEIIAVLGYNGTNTTVYDNTLQVMGMLATIIAQTGNLTGIDYVVLEFGSNAIALPKQPSDTSIEFVMSNVTGKFERVDYYNPATQEWEVYVPDAPFGNTLDTMEIGKVYWIFAKESCILYIK